MSRFSPHIPAALLAVLLLVTFAGTARASHDAIPMEVESTREFEWTQFGVAVDFGCQYFLSEGGVYDEPAECGVLRLRITRGGRDVFSRRFREYEGGGFLKDEYYRWGCKRTGLHRWSATFQPPRSTEIVEDSGAFRVPRCAKRRSRMVPQGVAVDDAAQETPNSEIAFEARCRAGGRRSGARASKWYCGVASTGLRDCARFYALTYYRSGGFNPENTHSVRRWRRTQCFS